MPLEDKISEISDVTIARYSSRYQKMGYDVKTLGWGTTEQQIYRFAQTLFCGLDFEGKTILDIGCGFGDYYAFLNEEQTGLQHYIGWDINPDLIQEAKKRAAKNQNASFEVKNLMEQVDHQQAQPVADIAVMLGVLNFNLKDTADNVEYSKLAIKKALSVVKEALVVDFLSTHKTPHYPAEDFVYYHDPAVMLAFALTLSDDVVLKHDYRPIPQKEFMLIIKKNTR